MDKKINKSRAGFTIIELLVSVSIIALISASVLTNFRYAHGRGELNIAAQKLASDIKAAQSHALGLDKHNGNVPPGGWGIYLRKTVGNNDFYIMFADDSGNHYYGPGELFKPILKLPPGVTINDLLIDGIAYTSAYITFEPPDPTVRICYNLATCNTAGSFGNILEIQLSSDGGATVKSVTVNVFGLVDVAG